MQRLQVLRDKGQGMVSAGEREGTHGGQSRSCQAKSAYVHVYASRSRVGNQAMTGARHVPPHRTRAQPRSTYGVSRTEAQLIVLDGFIVKEGHRVLHIEGRPESGVVGPAA